MTIPTRLIPLGFKKPVTAKDYIQDGLVAMWDGIENAGWGVHDASATTWVELVSNSSINLSDKGTFTDDAFSFSRRAIDDLTTSALLSAIGSSIFTAEAVFSSASINTEIYTGGSPKGLGFATLSDYAIRILSGDTIIARTAAEVGQSIGAYSIARSGLKAKAYSNGVQLGDETTCAAIGNPTYGLDIPALRTINNIRFYSRALTTAEIARNHEIDKVRFNLPTT